MHRVHPVICLAVLASAAAAVAGCGSAGGGGATVATTPQAQRSVVQHGGAITVRGDYAPDQHGPYTLRGRYRVRFTQRGAGVDFTHEVPFAAHLEQPDADGPGKSIRLFERAAATGTATVTADGRYEVVIDYGDSPYTLVLTPVS
jgi:hypothetical protein